MTNNKTLLRRVAIALLFCLTLNVLCLGAALAEEQVKIVDVKVADVPNSANSAAMEAAHAAGPDVVGILEAGPDIAVYVAQGEDNDYYLTHDVSQAANNNGAAFLDCRASLNPRSQHLMIHGHNMRSGAVFGNLDFFKDPAYVKANPLFYWTTDEGTEVYVPYSIATISVEPSEDHYFKMTEFDFDDDDSFLNFALGLISRSEVTLPTTDIRLDDQLLSLVTCGYEYDNGRLIVALRKLREDETEESIKQLFEENL